MRRWAAAVLLCAVGATGCGADGAASSPSSSSSPPSSSSSAPVRDGGAPPVPGIDAEAVQLRTDVAVGGRIHVRITASDTFTVTSVALDSPGFAALPPRETDSEFVPGRVTDLTTPLGAVRCDRPPEPASARLTVVRGGAPPERVAAPLAAEDLVRIHADECAEEALAERVTIEVADLRAEPDAVAATLVVTRRSGQKPVRVTRILRSVLIAVEADLPLELAADAPSARTALRFTPATCAPHVLAESKQPYVFPVGVEVGAEDEVVDELPVDAALRMQLQDLVDRVCVR